MKIKIPNLNAMRKYVIFHEKLVDYENGTPNRLAIVIPEIISETAEVLFPLGANLPLTRESSPE